MGFNILLSFDAFLVIVECLIYFFYLGFSYVMMGHQSICIFNVGADESFDAMLGEKFF